MLRFSVAGWTKCRAFSQAKASLLGLSALFPSRLSVNVQEHPTRDEYMTWLASFRGTVNAPTHNTSPLVWTDDRKFVGGRTETVAFCRDNIADIAGITASTRDAAPSKQQTREVQVDDGYTAEHGYDYDMVVIGGGSGGLACSKEAAKRGAKVAVLDYVKPSPHGTSWGLGGTCVNVGCIPKKLMHHAALLGHYTKDAAEYGWTLGSSSSGDGAAGAATAAGVAATSHDWDSLRTAVQGHIKGLNFGYKVQLRDASVTYVNKHAHFVSPHEIEVVDKKGNREVISAARFVIAVGGRPSRLSIPGGQHAITSDDLFSLKQPPGRTCVLGAGYVALECAGFISGLNQGKPGEQGDVTVLVRSMPLRGFDRDIVQRVVDYMAGQGTRILEGVTPTRIDKLPARSVENSSDRDRYRVHFSSGGSDTFDTVLTAVGRTADTAPLGLEEVGVVLNPSNGKVVGRNEQSSVPHIYAIGDVLDQTPELTPVAIKAGQLLARRLVNPDDNEPLPVMDYSNIATAVFTPLELGTVGLTEEAAAAQYGAEHVDAYLSSFTPLEMSLLHLDSNPCLAKVVIHRSTRAVLGLHIAAPNAGEVVQGFAVAMQMGGLTMEHLRSTVGIHPTVAEELVQLTVTKSSGESADKSGC